MVLSMAPWEPSKQPPKHSNKKQGHTVLWMVAWKTLKASTQLNYSTTMLKEKPNRNRIDTNNNVKKQLAFLTWLTASPHHGTLSPSPKTKAINYNLQKIAQPWNYYQVIIKGSKQQTSTCGNYVSCCDYTSRIANFKQLLNWPWS
jgi:hypothetical protein